MRAGGQRTGFLAAALAAALLAGACKRPEATTPNKGPRVEDFAWGPVQVRVTLDPPVVDLARGIEMTLTVTAPPDIEVQLPALQDRLQGFTLSGSFEDEPVVRDGKRVRRVHYQLTPAVAPQHRVAPFAVEYEDRAVHPPQKGWFPTRPIVLERTTAGAQGGQAITPQFDPVRIAPPARAVLFWAGGCLLLAGLGWLLWKMVTRVRESVQLARMSPRERALKELERLLAKDLVRRNRVKDFYLELTMIVRRYIERGHGVRAPEQTTEEFLAAVSADPRFAPEVVRTLRNFLQAADLVKFAADRPDEESIRRATATAREYIERDAATAPAQGGS